MRNIATGLESGGCALWLRRAGDVVDYVFYAITRCEQWCAVFHVRKLDSRSRSYLQSSIRKQMKRCRRGCWSIQERRRIWELWQE